MIAWHWATRDIASYRLLAEVLPCPKTSERGAVSWSICTVTS